MDATAPDEALRAYLAEEIAIYEGYGDPSKLPSIFLDLFTTYRDEDCQTATHNVTRRINAEYWDVYLPSDSLIKSQEDKGMAEFLSRLNNLVFGLALLIGYDDPRQDALLQVLVELRKLPPKPFKVWRGEYLVYVLEPMFAAMGEEGWHRNFAYKTPGLQDDESAKAAHQKKCDEWVNFSAFLARCTGAGFYDQYSGVFLYPSVDISLALEKKLPTGSLRACRLMVAAQWILHSGRRIHDSMVEENKKDWDLERWSVWEARLKEIVDGGEGDEEVASVLRRTLAEMTSIDASA